MQQIWSDEELRAHWVLSAPELGLLNGISEQRRLTLCYDLKHFQLHAQFPKSLDFVSPQVLKFFWHRRSAPPMVMGLSAFLDWLVQTILPTAPKEARLDGMIPNWFLSNRMMLPKAKAVANLVAKAGHRFERVVFARIAGRLVDDQRVRLDALLETTDGFSPFADVSRSSGGRPVSIMCSKQ